VKWTQSFVESERFGCYPDKDTVNEDDCKKRGCLWETVTRILIMTHAMISE
jgi:hypothetical protein